MEFIQTISLGEALVAGGTVILAIVTAVIAVSRSKEDRERWRRDIQLRYKREILDGLESWLETVANVLNESLTMDALDKGYLRTLGEMRGRLMGLYDGAIVILRKGVGAFEKYGFMEEFSKLLDKYAEYLDMLKDLARYEPKKDEKEIEKKMEEDMHCRVELCDGVNVFSRYIVGIREKEEL